MVFSFVRCTVFLFLPIFLFGQTFREVTLPISNAQKTFADPFTGGMKCPQFSETDEWDQLTLESLQHAFFGS